MMASDLIRDINVLGAPEVAPESIVAINGKIVFTAQDPTRGRELWVSDGTTNGTQLLREFVPGANGAQIKNLVAAGNRAYFTFSTSTGFDELWRTDGTAAGTVLVFADLNVVSGMTNVNGKVFFAAENSKANPRTGIELWTSDGTAAGTRQVADINPGSNDSRPFMLTAVQNQLYFVAANDSDRRNTELYISDGTAAGTRMVKDLVPGVSGAFNKDISSAVAVGNQLFFSSFSFTQGYALSVSNGTDAGTRQLVGGGFKSPSQLTEFNGRVLGSAGVNNRQELVISNGTDAGTTVLRTGDPIYGLAPQNIVTVGSRAFFAGRDATNGVELWMTDGTTLGTTLVKDIRPGVEGSSPRSMVAFQNQLYFVADNGTNGFELWRSDGTAAGTVLVKDIFADGTRSERTAPSKLTVSGNRIYFIADDGINGRQLWQSDGTTAGTSLVRVINATNASSKPDSFAKLGNEIVFVANDGLRGGELWKTDGTSAGTKLILDVLPGEPSSVPSNLISANGLVFFTAGIRKSFAANLDGRPEGLWRTDGTAAGTFVIASQIIEKVAAVGNTVYFTGPSGNGYALYKTDGTVAGTVLVKDGFPALGSQTIDADAVNVIDSLLGIVNQTLQITDTNGPGPTTLTDINGKLYFAADDGVNGRELWTSDGTAAGTVMVKDLLVGFGSSIPRSIVRFGNQFFIVTDNRELWISNGTSVGTNRLRSFTGNVTDPVVINNQLYFYADDAAGKGLWKSNGSVAGTTFVAMLPGTASRLPRNFTAVGRVIYFTAVDPSAGLQLWTSDGSTAGTKVVTTLQSIAAVDRLGAGASKFTVVDGRLFFVLSVGSKTFLWTTDGTEAGTYEVADLGPRSVSSIVSTVASVGGKLIYTGFDSLRGSELWQLDVSPPPPSSPVAVAGVVQSDLAIERFTVTPTTQTVGNNLAYEIIVSNRGPNAATGVELRDVLPAGLVLASATTNRGTYSQNGQEIKFAIGSLAVNATATIRIEATAQRAGTFVNTVQVAGVQSDSNTANNSSSQTSTIILGPPGSPTSTDLAITSITSSSLSIPEGGVVDYDIFVRNQGPAIATGVVVEIELPAGATPFFVLHGIPIVVPNGTRFLPVGTASFAGNKIFVRADILQPGETFQTNLTVIASQAGNGLVKAKVIGDQTDLALGNNNGSINVDVQAPPAQSPSTVDLELTSFTEVPNPAYFGDNVTYQAIITNRDDNLTATGINTSYQIFSLGGEEFVSAKMSQGTFTRVNDEIRFNVGSLAPGQSATIEIVVKLSGAPGTRTQGRGLAAFGSQPDHNTKNNFVGLKYTSIGPFADLDITRFVANKAPVAINDPVTYSLEVTNNGRQPAEGTKLTVNIPPNMTVLTATPSSGSTNQTATLLTFNLGTIPAGGKATATLVARFTTLDKSIFVASTSSNTLDPNIGNNFEFLSSTVVPLGPRSPNAADMEITELTATPDPVTVGSPLTYRIIVTNRGEKLAREVVVNDILPAGVHFLSSTSTQGGAARDGNRLTFELGDLAPGASATILVGIQPTLVGTLRNSVSVRSSDVDPFPADNDATISTTVIAVPPPITGADLSITNVADPNPVSEGSLLRYQLTVSNNGPDIATNVVVTDILPKGSKYFSATTSQGQFAETTARVVGNLGTLAPGATATITILVTAVERELFVNTATVTSSVTDPNLKNNTATEVTAALAVGEGCAAQLTDINLNGAGSMLELSEAFSTSIVALNGVTYYTANDGIHGTEIWRTDGTEAGTRLLKDINPNGGSDARGLFVVGNRIGFSANNGTGDTFWLSDGTEAGTTVFDGFGSGRFVNSTAGVRQPVVSNGIHYFQFVQPSTGIRELRRDRNGSFEVLKVFPTGHDLSNLVDVNGKLYFFVNYGTNIDLWVSDGSSAGTKLVANVNSAATTNFNPLNIVLGTFGNKLVFSTQIANQNRIALWISDGTAAGTFKLREFAGLVRTLTQVGNKLYFGAESGTNQIAGVWETDGSIANTKLAVATNRIPAIINRNGSLLYFVQNANLDIELYASNGTPAGTILLKNVGSTSDFQFQLFDPTKSIVLGNSFYFRSTVGGQGGELWRTDGTVAGTRQVIDIFPGTTGSNPYGFVINNGLIYFAADDGKHGVELWKTDGTAANTKLVNDTHVGTLRSSPVFLGKVGNNVFFAATDQTRGRELWITNGTAAGTRLVADLTPGIGSSSPKDAIVIGNKLYFLTEPIANQRKLYVSDGTTTTFLRDFTNDPLGNNPSNLVDVAGTLYFSTSTASKATLWKSTGTSGSTQVVATLDAKGVSKLTAVGSRVYFLLDPLTGFSSNLWKSDGTAATTSKVSNRSLVGFSITMVAYNNALYFAGSQQDSAGIVAGLWTSDGTEIGTKLLVAAPAGFNNISVQRNRMFFETFVATPGGGPASLQLWTSDGTVAGTTPLKTIPPTDFNGNFPIDIDSIVSDSRYTYFIVNELFGNQLWRTDGTTNGTIQLLGRTAGGTDLITGLFLIQRKLVTSNNKVYFVALTEKEGFELWESDGTTVGTKLSQDIQKGADFGFEGSYFSFPERGFQGIDLNGSLLFNPTDGFHGSELWKLQCSATRADLTLAMTSDTRGSVAVGDLLTYTINVGNLGTNVAAATTLSDTLPNHLELVSVSTSRGTFSQSGQTLNIQLGDLVAGANASATITARVKSASPIVHQVQVRSATFDPNLRNNTATLTHQVIATASADLAVEVSNSPGVLIGGDRLTYSLIVTNRGPTTATGIKLTNTLPNGVTFTGDGEDAKRLQFEMGSLAPGESAQVQFFVNPRTAGALTNVAVVTANEPDPNRSNNSAESTALVTIAVPKPSPALATLGIVALNADRAEGNSGDTPFTFTVTRTVDQFVSTTVNFAVTGSGTAPANAFDFGGTLPSGKITFAPNETSKTLTVLVRGDVGVEANETFAVTLSGATGNALIRTPSATGTIRNDERAVGIVAVSADKLEGNFGTTAYTFNVNRSGDLTSAATVNFAVTGGTTSPADATDFGGSFPTGQVSFAAGEITKPITINVRGDLTVEPNESFAVTLTNATNGTSIVTATAAGVIRNDDTTSGCLTGGPFVVGQNRLTYSCVTPGGFAGFISGTKLGPSTIARYGVTVDIADPSVPAMGVGNAQGVATVIVTLTAAQLSQPLYFQAFEMTPNKKVSNVLVAHSAVAAADANRNGSVSPIDALVVVNRISRQSGASGEGASLLTVASDQSDPHDVNGDGFVSPIDVLWIINQLRRNAAIDNASSFGSVELPLMQAIDSVPPFDDDPFDDELGEDVIEFLAVNRRPA